jgi:SAM-dependent methyltransferase
VAFQWRDGVIDQLAEWRDSSGDLMPDPGGRLHGDAAVNREAWQAVNARYASEHAIRAWQAAEITWGIFDIPERELGVLGPVADLDVVELGCGTAYFSAWLARRGARPVGVDVSPAQLDTARRCQDRYRTRFPLIEADAADVPLPDGSFDLAISECGASLYCDPDRWIPEAARLLRPGGRLVFHVLSVLVMLCLPEDGPAGRELVRPQWEISRLRRDRGVEFHPGHGEWIRVLRSAGFVIDALHELRAPFGARDHPYYQLATARWSEQWPVEEIWAAHLPAT